MSTPERPLDDSVSVRAYIVAGCDLIDDAFRDLSPADLSLWFDLTMSRMLRRWIEHVSGEDED